MILTLKILCVVCVICGCVFAQSDTLFSEWRPNADTRGIRFVGNNACVDCHPREAAHELSQSFCGTCHTSFEQAMLQPGQSGINNIRFQPYRMFNGRGHNTNDPRVSCLAL